MFSTLKNKVVIIIGCGGTGSWTIQHILQSLIRYSLLNEESLNRLILIDGDLIEPKNLIRQAFLESEIGETKSKALAKRFFKAYEEPVNLEKFFIEKFILDDLSRNEHLDKFIDIDLSKEFYLEDSLTIVISLIDNNKTRKKIHNDFINNSKVPHLIIDAGNEDIFGQTTLSSYSFNEFKDKNYYDLYPHMNNENDGVQAGPSCADFDEQIRNSELVQTASANINNALLVSSIFEDLLNNKITHSEIKFVINKDIVRYAYTDL